MKTQILDITGGEIKEIETNLFEEPIREDIIYKVVEAEKLWQPYSPKYRSGMNRSASGNVRHVRHSWKTDRGRGLSRIPRKIFWRRGTQFSWEGAIVPSTKGGRRAHPPKGSVNLKKINKKEMKKALLSSLTYTSSIEEIKNKYASLSNKKEEVKLPIIVENKILELGTKDFFSALKKILGDLYEVSVQKKSIRAGKGKLRGRKYKKNAGLLLVIGKNEVKKIKGVDIVKANELIVSDLANNGARLSMFTEKAIKELEEDLLKTRKKEKTEKIKKNNKRKLKKEKVRKKKKKVKKNKEKKNETTNN